MRYEGKNMWVGFSILGDPFAVAPDRESICTLPADRLLEYRVVTSLGAELIAAERQRQIKDEGWTPEHDDEHDMGEMAAAAMCYASLVIDKDISHIMETDSGQFAREWWPWDMEWWKPSKDPIRNLVKAGALIAAEIDRLQREKARG